MNKASTDTPHGQLTDERLVTRAKLGDQNAFEDLVRRHRGPAIGLAARICGPGDAEDAVQAAFLSLWQGIDAYRPERASVKTWLFTIVRNRAIDVLRSRPAAEPTSIDSHPEEADPVHTEALIAQREESVEVRRAVAELPGDQRQVLELAYFKEFSQPEIARALKLPLGTVKGRARLGKMKLPDRLGPLAPARA
jgi:RNA polymerase sigma-70 factor (ECF subfamily)